MTLEHTGHVQHEQEGKAFAASTHPRLPSCGLASVPDEHKLGGWLDSGLLCSSLLEPSLHRRQEMLALERQACTCW